ncbi:MAG: helix-turn-helix domain-containing protein [Ramlibacter sp.]
MPDADFSHRSRAAAAGALPAPSGVQVIPFRPREPRPGARLGLRVPCVDCRVRESCLPAGLPDSAMRLLDQEPFGRRRVLQGQMLFLEGDRVRSIYAVRRGSFKSSLLLRDGRDQVTRFPMAGDLLGLDGMAGGTYASTAVALEDSEVCAIPVEAIHELSLHHPEWQDTLCRAMGRELVRENQHMLVLGSAGTEGRLAMFLLELSEAMKARGYSPTEFHMRMSRAEIGSYVGLTLETVSRTFSSFQQRGVLKVQKRHVTIESLPALQGIRDRDGA